LGGIFLFRQSTSDKQPLVYLDVPLAVQQASWNTFIDTARLIDANRQLSIWQMGHIHENSHSDIFIVKKILRSSDCLISNA